jgi:hypothetical protein
VLREKSIEVLDITLKSVVGPIHKLLVAAVLITNVPAVTGVANDKEKGRGVEGPEAAVIS